jgi:carbonic anhydrase
MPDFQVMRMLFVMQEEELAMTRDSLIISYKLLGTAEWFVIHHTDCGMETFTDDIIRDLLSTSLSTATDANGWRNITEGVLMKLTTFRS